MNPIPRRIRPVIYKKSNKESDSFGFRIRQIREAWGWSQEKFAKLIGAPPSTVYGWMRDKNQHLPGLVVIEKLAELFGMPIEALKTGVGFKVPPVPKQIGGIWVSDAHSRSMVVLPHNQGGVVLIEQALDEYRSANWDEALAVMKQARIDEAPVWIVIGLPDCCYQ